MSSPTVKLLVADLLRAPSWEDVRKIINLNLSPSIVFGQLLKFPFCEEW
jgi:hypothetical protein